MIQYEEVAPPAILAPLVRCIWMLTGDGDPSRLERILPDGSFELVFHRGDPFTEEGRRQPSAMLVGRLNRPTIVASGRCVDAVGIRLRRGAFNALTGLHAAEFSDRVHDLRDVLGDDDFDAVISKLSRTAAETDRRVDTAVTAIVRFHGSIRIDDLAPMAGASPRTLERLFQHHVGLSPKELARIVRFQAELRGLDGGYYDDSHRCREFQELAGMSPAALQSERAGLTDVFVTCP